MRSEKLKVVRGSGNVFRDLGHENADAEQFKTILALEIIKALDREGLSVRAAHSRTGIAAADFSRIRNADLGGFTRDQLMSIINRLGSRVEVKVRVRRAEQSAEGNGLSRRTNHRWLARKMENGRLTFRMVTFSLSSLPGLILHPAGKLPAETEKSISIDLSSPINCPDVGFLFCVLEFNFNVSAFAAI